MALKIVPYSTASESAKALADLLGAKRVKPDSSTYVPRHFDYLLNWGNSRSLVFGARAQARSVSLLNKPESVNRAANKLTTFQIMAQAGISIPEFTVDINTARRWLSTGSTVVERHELRGNSGQGIRIVNLDDPDMPSDLLSAPLYTKFINKTAEYRVHVFGGQVIDYIEKRKLATERRPANFNKYISSVNFGWVFTRTNVLVSPQVKDLAVRAVNALGLDFGAVDIVFANGQAYVLEVNSSPGLKGTTLVAYANAIRGHMGAAPLQPAQVSHLIDPVVTQSQPVQPVAAVQASVNRPSVTMNGEMVTLRISRTMAVQLRELLAGI